MIESKMYMSFSIFLNAEKFLLIIVKDYSKKLVALKKWDKIVMSLEIIEFFYIYQLSKVSQIFYNFHCLQIYNRMDHSFIRPC